MLGTLDLSVKLGQLVSPCLFMRLSCIFWMSFFVLGSHGWPGTGQQRATFLFLLVVSALVGLGFWARERKVIVEGGMCGCLRKWLRFDYSNDFWLTASVKANRIARDTVGSFMSAGSMGNRRYGLLYWLRQVLIMRDVGTSWCCRWNVISVPSWVRTWLYSPIYRASCG
jgi:hypothetical protein